MIAQNILATMSFSHMFTAFLFSLIVCLVISECHADVNANASHISKLVIDARTRRPIPDTFFGAFFEVNYNICFDYCKDYLISYLVSDMTTYYLLIQYIFFPGN